MRRLIVMPALVVAAVTFLSLPLLAQTGMPPDHARYDTSAVETISGTVIAVEMQVAPGGGHYGVHLKVRTGEEIIPVHLGPSWYLERQESQLQVGDEVEVIGSLITFQDAPAILAARVRRGEDMLVLRDEQGYPVWRGWRRGGQARTPMGMRRGQS